MLARSHRLKGRTATIGTELPSFPRSVRFTEQELDLLARLQRRLAGRSQHDILGMALVHLWQTLQRDERVYLVLDEEEGNDGGRTKDKP